MTRPAPAGRVRHHTTIASPIGPLLLVEEDGVLTGLYVTDRPDPPGTGTHDVRHVRDAGPLRAVIDQIDAYFAGTLTEFELPFSAAGTPFQRRVWAELARVPYGATTSYGELAAAIGRPTAARAVGAANGRNPISLVLPCHRVVGSSGHLTGYAAGLDRKCQLLEHEARVLGSRRATDVT